MRVSVYVICACVFVVALIINFETVPGNIQPASNLSALACWVAILIPAIMFVRGRIQKAQARKEAAECATVATLTTIAAASKNFQDQVQHSTVATISTEPKSLFEKVRK